MNTSMVQYGVSDMERMARAFAVSKLFGVQNPEQALALCLIAQAEGRHPASAAQDYHIINGRPSKKADAMLRDFISGGGKIEWHELSDVKADATFAHPAGGTVRIDWDLARAKKAGIKNAMWDKYPRSMLRARVVSEGVRTVYPMATSGMYVPEEVSEFDAPSQAPAPSLEAPEGAPTTIDGEVIEAKPKRLSRDDFDRLVKDVRSCQNIEELSFFWSARQTQEEVAALPADWRVMLIEEKDDRKSALTNDANAPGRAYVPPNFDSEGSD